MTTRAAGRNGYVDFDRLHEHCIGRWSVIYQRMTNLDIDKLLEGKKQPCPMCTGSNLYFFKDEFEATGKIGCHNCDPAVHSGIWGIRAITNRDIQDVAREVADIVGYSEDRPKAQSGKGGPNRFRCLQTYHNRCQAAVTDPVIEAYAKRVGVSADAAMQLQIGYDDADTRLGPCWTFPEWGFVPYVGLAVIGIQRVFVDPRRIDGELVKKRTAPGGKRGVYLPEGWEDHDSIVIVEGESCTAAAIDSGMGVLGRPSASGGAKILKKLLEDFQGKVLICGENDQKGDGRWPGRDGPHKIGITLSAFGLNVHVAMPPLMESGNDLRDWCRQEINADLRRLEETWDLAEPSPPSKHNWCIKTFRPENTSRRITVDDVNEAVRDSNKLFDAFEQAAHIIEANWVDEAGNETLRYWKDEFWHYRDGVYHVVEPQSIVRTVRDNVSMRFNKLKNSDIQNTVNTIRTSLLLNREAASGVWLDGRHASHMVNVANGLLDPVTGNLSQHTPQFFSITQIPVPYMSGVKSVVWEKAISDVQEDDPERVRLLQEFAGYVLWPDVEFHKFLLLQGDGSNGKSVFLNGLAEVLGEKNMSSITLESLASQQFSVEGLHGKMANICAEISSVTGKRSNMLKALVSGDTVTADRKYKSALQFRNRAKLIFSCNELPNFRDRSDGTLRRQLIVPFNLKYLLPHEWADRERENRIGTRHRKLDPQFAADKFWQPHASAIMNWMLDGLRRLLDQKAFTVSKVVQRAIEAHKRESCSVRTFLHECIEHDPDENSFIYKSRLYDSYRDFCQSSGYQSLNANHFYKQMVKWEDECGAKRVQLRRDGERVRGYRYIRHQQLPSVGDNYVPGDVADNVADHQTEAGLAQPLDDEWLDQL